MASTGAGQVDLIAFLINSTASEAEQLALATRLVGFSLPQDNQILCWAPDLQQRLPSPKHERVLKWLLSKIDRQIPGPDLTIVNPDAWYLISGLMFYVPVKNVLRELQHVDLFRCIDNCLQYTRRELAALDVLSQCSTGQMIVDSYDMIGDASNPRTQMMRGFKRLVCVCQVLKDVEQTSPGYQRCNYSSELTRKAIRLSFDRAATIIGSGLWCARPFDSDISRGVVASLIEVWNLASERTSSNKDVLYTARLFAQYCLQPSLELAVVHVGTNLDNFILQHCLMPLKLATQDELAEILAIMFTSISQSFSQNNDESNANGFTSADHGQYSTEQPDLTRLKVIPLVVQLFSRLNSVEPSAKNDFTTQWHREVFSGLAGCLDINLTAPHKQNLSVLQSTGLVYLTRAFRDIGVSPGLPVLSTTITFFTDQDFQRFSEHPWEVIKMCLDMQHEIVSNGSAQAGKIIEHILDAIIAVDHHRGLFISSTKAHLFALELLLKPLLGALIRGRKLSHFPPLWKDNTMLALRRLAEKSSELSCIKPQETFWELDAVLQAIKSSLVEGMNVIERLEMFTNYANIILEGQKNDMDLITHYSTAILLTAIVSSLAPKDVSLAHKQHVLPYNFVWELYNSTVQHYIAAKDRWRSNTLLSLLEELRLLTIDHSIPSEVISIDEKLIPVLAAQIFDTLDNDGALAAWLYLLNLTARCQSPILGQTLRELFSRFNEFLAILRDNSCIPHSALTRHSSIPDRHFIYSCLSDFMYCPTICRLVEDTEIRKLVENLYACAFLFESKGTNPWLNLWQNLMHSSMAREEETLYRAIHEVRINSFIDEGSKLLSLPQNDQQTRLAFYEFALKQLSASSTSLISKDYREKLVNKLLASLSSTRLTPKVYSMSLGLLRRLTQPPDRLSGLATDLGTIWGICRNVEPVKDSFEVLEDLQVITQNLLLHWMDPKENFKTKAFVGFLQDYIRTTTSNKTTNSGIETVIATTMATLARYTDYADLIAQDLQLQFLEDQIQRLVQLHPYSSLNATNSSIQMNMILDNIARLPLPASQNPVWQRKITQSDQLANNASIGDYTKTLNDHLSSRVNNPQQYSLSLTDASCYSKIQQIVAKMANTHGNSAKYLVEELSLLPHGSMKQRIRELWDVFQGLSTEDKAELLSELSNRLSKLGTNQVKYLRKLLSHSFSVAEQQFSSRTALQGVFNSCYGILYKPGHVSQMADALRLMHTILDQNVWMVTQDHVDGSLKAATWMTQPENNCIEATSSQHELIAKMFNRVVELVSVIFQKHRSRIGQRWPNVLEALKGILYCLFVPYPDLPAKDGIPQPQWITVNNSESLKDENVSKFSRLLGMICDPSYKALGSKATPTHGRQSLNDASKKARAIAGQQMQSIVAVFCSLQLRGKMVHRDAIRPGLYAIFDAMDQKVQQSLNESLDAQSRVMFKELYDDWKKFGKWDGN